MYLSTWASNGGEGGGAGGNTLMEIMYNFQVCGRLQMYSLLTCQNFITDQNA